VRAYGAACAALCYGCGVNLRALLLPDLNQKGPIALLLIRAATGLVLVPHGYFKLMGGPAGLAAGLAAKGFPAATVLAWCATLAELVGGLCLAVGLLGRPAAAVVSFTMVVAWASSHLGNIADIGGPKGGAFEYPFVLSVIAFALAFSGPGRLSLDAVLVRRLK
jgi:putative oxidoreductase